MPAQYILHTIDGDLEAFSEREANTRSCPLLPGQTLNILDVPLQTNLIAGRNVSSASIDSLVFTLDPKDKYLPPHVRRAATTSAIKQRKARMGSVPKILHRAASTPLQSGDPPETSNSSQVGPSTLKRQRSLLSVFQRMRQTRSAGSNTKSGLTWPRRVFSRTGQSAKVEAAEDIPEVPKLPAQIPGVNGTGKTVGAELRVQQPSAQDVDRALQAATEVVEESVVAYWPQERIAHGDYPPGLPCMQDLCLDGKSNSAVGILASSMGSSCPTPPEHLLAPDSYFTNFSAVVGDDAPLSLSTGQQGPAEASNGKRGRAEESQHPDDRLRPETYAYPESSSFRYAPSDDMSPGDLASNTTHSDPMSPLHLSQPETPTMSDFEDGYDSDFLQLQRYSKSSAVLTAEESTMPDATMLPPSRAPPPPPPQARPMTPRSALSGFQGYSLPQDDYKSVLTIRKPPSTTFSTADAIPSFPQHSNKRNLVHSWNDGSEQLLDDLGYLGELII
jgi:hypothetical protein